ncbi:MAG: hypothetical protein Tsb0021_16430 [Chlamydiales bacterium]
MWPKKYRDYPEDTPLIKEQIEPNEGKCEMHELNGWQESLHVPRRSENFIYRFLRDLFGTLSKK